MTKIELNQSDWDAIPGTEKPEFLAKTEKLEELVFWLEGQKEPKNSEEVEALRENFREKFNSFKKFFGVESSLVEKTHPVFCNIVSAFSQFLMENFENEFEHFREQVFCEVEFLKKQIRFVLSQKINLRRRNF